ncbi:MAG: MraY family glycosyltransferase [Gemmatimonadota bacterium]
MIIDPLTLLALGGAAALCGALVFAARVYALRVGVLDHPNARSSHSRPTPRVGGAGLVPSILLVFVISHDVGSWRLGLALGGVVTIALIGWVDDRRSIAVMPRLLTHTVGSAMILPLAVDGLGAGGAAAWLVGSWWLLAGVASVNLTNFMDGIDGLVGVTALVFGIHLVTMAGSGSAAFHLGIALAGTSIGFLWWNWAPARIFLGDGGSGALGLTFILGGLLLMISQDVSLVRAFLPLYPLFLDATVTLLRRALLGERVTEPHRSHFYQQLANDRFGHAPVSLAYGLAAAVGLALSHASPGFAFGAFLLTYFAAVPLVATLVRRSLIRSADSPSGQLG